MTQGQTTLIQNQPYIFGHADHELDRLLKQAQFFGDLTAHVLTLAGLGPGMRVLDIGCGAGDVSFLAAKFVGPDAGIYEQVAQVTRTLLPLIERTGVATAEEIDIETLAARLRHESLALDATLVSPALIGAWTRISND